MKEDGINKEQALWQYAKIVAHEIAHYERWRKTGNMDHIGVERRSTQVADLVCGRVRCNEVYHLTYRQARKACTMIDRSEIR